MLDWDNFRIFFEFICSQGLVDVVKKLGIDYFIVLWCMKCFEEQVGSQLFDCNNYGYKFIVDGYWLVEYVEQVESILYVVIEELGGYNSKFFGQVWLGVIEGFGIFVLVLQIVYFCVCNFYIMVDMLLMLCFVNLFKYEVDISVLIEWLLLGNYVVIKLFDYVLKFYVLCEYLVRYVLIYIMDDLV